MEEDRVHVTISLTRQGKLLEARDKEGKVRELVTADGLAPPAEGKRAPNGRLIKHVTPVYVVIAATDNEGEETDPCWIYVNGQWCCVCPRQFCGPHA